MSPEEPAPWYEKAVVYQIPVALFQDTTGNGWGDLPGVTRRLDHVKDVGADAVWLTPFYRTPYVDGGYDVVDHLDVSDRFGTLEDFKDLMDRAGELDLEVIVDLVVQHTSSSHPWFRHACRDRASRYRDYFIWADEPHETRVQPMFPTVEDSVWTWQEEAGQYYRHTFYHHEPDLNVANPDVRAEIRRIMEFWLELGVAGFRVDAVPYIVREAAEVDGYDDGLWILEEMRETVHRHRPDGVLIAEADVTPEQYADYFGNGNRFTMLLNFWLNNHLFLALAREEAEPLRRALAEQPDPPDGCHYAIWLRNHDELDLERLSDAEREETMAVFAPHPQMRAYGRGIRRRLAPMLSDPRQRKLALFLLCSLPGTPFLLYGDEIGMGDDLELPDRAAVRTPMQWSAERPNAGFSDADPLQTVQPVIQHGPFGYPNVNVADQRDEPGSMLRTFHRLFDVRREQGPLLTTEARPLALEEPAVFAVRYDDGGHSSLLLANLGSGRIDVALPEEHQEGWEEILADHAYDDDPKGDILHLHGFGYRWLRAASGTGKGNR
jgi:maltose alpha-D-glucosyltransferase/alpha-amylase